jgi:hypothetical protein
MSNSKKKDNTINSIGTPGTLKDTIASVISKELDILEQKSKKYHPDDSNNHNISIQDSVKKIGDEFEITQKQKASGILKFSIPKDKVGQKKATIVDYDQSTKNIPVDQLSDEIKKNKNINKVIIEEINLNDVKRTQIHFDKARPPINQKLVAPDSTESEQIEFTPHEDTPTDSITLEDRINQDFFTAIPSFDKPARLKVYEQFHNNHAKQESKTEIQAPVKSASPEEHTSLANIKNSQAENQKGMITIHQEKVTPETVIFSSVTDKQQNDRENKKEKATFDLNLELPSKKEPKKSTDNFTLNDSSVKRQDGSQEISFSLKQSTPTEVQSDNDQSNNANYFEAHKTEYSRKKELAKKSISSLYYKTKKHNELFKLGTLFYRDLELGLKSFAFTGQDQNCTAQQNTILGLSAYFSYHMKMTSTVFTESFEGSVFKREDKIYEIETIEVGDGLTIQVYTYADLKVIELCELEKISEFSDVSLLEQTLENIIDGHELVFWDLPTPKRMERSNELYFPITRVIDNVSLIIKPNNSKIKELLALKEYFEKYNIQIKGMIMSDSKQSSSKDNNDE